MYSCEFLKKLRLSYFNAIAFSSSCLKKFVVSVGGPKKSHNATHAATREDANVSCDVTRGCVRCITGFFGATDADDEFQRVDRS